MIIALTWQTLRELEASFGDAFYLLDIRQFEANYSEFLNCFRSIYPRSNIGYSYKTNYIPRLCQSVNALGGYAEVVSQMEYDLAIRVGVPANRILFNGPLKGPRDLEVALLAGSIVNLDSVAEADVVADLAKRMPGRSMAVGLRCNFDIGEKRISRFGLDVAGGEIDQVLRILEPYPHCSIVGLHCHHSTSHRSADSFARRMRGLLDIHDAYFQGQSLRFLDVGGGYFGKMTPALRRQFSGPLPSYREYADAIAPQMAARFSGGTGPELILEPGVAIVSDVLQYVGKVVGMKTIRGRRMALVVGSVQNVKPSGTDKKLSLTVYRNENAEPARGVTDLVGYTCMEHDCLYEGYAEGIGLGDYVVFDNMGAYTVVFKPPFIRPNPPIVTYDSTTNAYALSRRQETFDDVILTYLI